MGQPQTQDDYFRTSRDEYVAEAFARALESGRRGFADSTKVDQQMPGAIELIRWLQTRPPFAKPTNSQADSSLAQQAANFLMQILRTREPFKKNKEQK